MKNLIKKYLTSAALVFAVAILTACGGGGSSGSTPDTTAPITTAAPAVSATTDTATTLAVTVNENGTGYYLAQPAAAAPATQAQVLLGTSFTLTANVPATPTITGLTFNTPYTIYFVAKDAANNVQAAVQNVAVTTAPTTTAGYVTQGSLTWMPVTSTDTWTNANTYCTTSTINGVTGWRMPTRLELSVLYTIGAMNGQGWTLNYTWSSTPFVANYYSVSLGNGLVNTNADATPLYVSCVH